jgi:hypothetical protein
MTGKRRTLRLDGYVRVSVAYKVDGPCVQLAETQGDAA